MEMVGQWTGREARALRVALRLSVRAFAERLGVAVRTVSKWEKVGGGITPWPDTQAILDTCLAQAGSDVQARFTLLATKATASASVEREVESADESQPADGSQLNNDERDHLVAALRDAGRYIDGSVVDYFRRQLNACMVNDGERGPAATLPAVLGLLRAIEQHSRDVRPVVRRELLSFGACGAEFAGWLFRDAHDPKRAGFWYDRAMEWAQEALDLPMQGYLLLKKSQMAYDTHDALRVCALAQAAYEGPWQLPVRVRAEVCQQVALGMAMLGEPLPTVERHLENAAKLLAQASPDDGGRDQIGVYFTSTTLLLRNASSYTEAGQPQRAAVLFGDVLINADLSRRDAGYFRARRAAALALSGEPDEAATVGLVSTETAVVTTSHRTLNVLDEVVRTLTPWHSRPLVRELCDAMATTRRPA